VEGSEAREHTLGVTSGVTYDNGRSYSKDEVHRMRGAAAIKTPTALLFSTSAMLFAFVAFAVRISGIGMFQTAAMHCPSRLPEVAVITFGLALAALVLAPSALLLEGLRRRKGVPPQGMESALVGLAVVVTAAVAVVPALIALTPLVCA
jgi:hypothetical protein